MSLLSDAQVGQYRKDGFLLVKGVFSAEEARVMQQAVALLPHGTTELFIARGLEHLWRDERIVGVAKRLLGDPITFFAEATTLRSVLKAGDYVKDRPLHHDAKGSATNLFERIHAPPTDPYPVVRFGIYLQDFKRHSGGLKVVPGSHMTDSSDFDQSRLSYLNVPSEPGDLICFCQKTLHAPFAMRLKDRPDHALSPAEESRLCRTGADLFLPPPENRDAIFMDFAGAGALADLHIKSRALLPGNLKTSVLHALTHFQLEQHAQALGINLRLDFGVVEAATGILTNMTGGNLGPAGVPYYQNFTRLCALSRETTSQFSLFSGPVEDTPESAAVLINQVFANIGKHRAMLKSVRYDAAMAAAAP
jgi:hypothetical protein